MRKFVLGLFILFGIFAFLSSAHAANVVRAATSLTGGGTGALDAISIADIADGDIAIVGTSDVMYFYQFNCPATTATSSPVYIRPASYGGTNACGTDGRGVWVLSSVRGNSLYGSLKTVVENTATTYNVTAEEARQGTFFLNTNAGTKTFVLPAVEAGMVVCARNSQGNAQILRIDTDGSDYIVMSTGARTASAGNYYGATSDDKNQVCVVGFDTTDWYVTSEVGTWTSE